MSEDKPQKSLITFGSRVEEEIQASIKDKLEILNVGGAWSYLGLPKIFSGSKKDMLVYIHENLKFRPSEWFARTLSQGGKKVLL